jgi:molybdopterin molybdotransferase
MCPKVYHGAIVGVATDRLERLRAEVLSHIERLPGERVALADAAGRWLAADVAAVQPAPPYACSAMDGYALAAADAAGPSRLRLVRALYAGDAPGEGIGPGQAVRIYTGAPLPPGAGAVVREEAAAEAGGFVALPAARIGENVRLAGEDVAAGATALEAGRRLGARQLALLAAVGVEQVEVVRRPRIALLSTGDELIAGRTPDSNGAALAALLAALGAEVQRRQLGDDLDRLTSALGEALAACDAVVTVGGVSVGARDHVPAAAGRVGATVHVHGVPMKPGKPFLFAVAGGRPLLGLPGSPSACLVAFEVFARPALLALAGASRPFRPALPLPLAEPVSGRPGRARFVWAALEGGRVRPVGRDAAQIRGPALADALLWLREGAGALPEGAPVEAWLLQGDGE